MGCIVNIKGCIETVLDPEKDLGILIDQYMGHDARNLYQDILDDHEAEISSLKYEYEQNEDDAAKYQDIIDSGRANLDYLIDEIENDDCPDRDYLLRKLRNIHWDMGY